jgi:hypothetical protein
MAVIPNNTDKSKIATRRLVIYDRNDMVSAYKNKYGSNPTSETELLQGLTISDFDEFTKHFSLIDFVKKTDNKSTYNISSDYFYVEYKNDKTKALVNPIYMQAGCTDGTNMYYILMQKDLDENKYERRSVIIKVFCRQVKGNTENSKQTVYYVNRTYVKPITLPNNMHKDYYEKALHGNDMTYIPDLPIVENNTVKKAPYILVCGMYSFMLINPNNLEVLEDKLIHLNGLLDFSGSNPINKEKFNYQKSPESNYKSNFVNPDPTQTYWKLYQVIGITYLKSYKVLSVNYNYMENLSEDAKNRGCYTIFYKFATSIEKMSSTNDFLQIIPVEYNSTEKDEYVDCNGICKPKNLSFTPDLYNSIGSLDTDNTRLFQVRSCEDCGTNSKFFNNRMYLFAPIYNEEKIYRYKLKEYLTIASGTDSNGNLTYEYLEVENVAWKKVLDNTYKFFLGYKLYIDHTNNNKYVYGTIMHFDYDVSDV